MKIFISHSSKNKDYGEALVDLLTGVGIEAEQIIFTSNDTYGIPTGQNIFNWLKSRIAEKPHVIYLLSPEYYSSVACLNEMGAAWVVENEHTMIFTPTFQLDSYEFQNGALDPREIGFYINNENRLFTFVDLLKEKHGITPKSVIINQKIKAFLDKVNSISSSKVPAKTKPTISAPVVTEVHFAPTEKMNPDKPIVKSSSAKTNNSTRFASDLLGNKLKDEEVLLIHYVIETGRFKLGAGWQEDKEVENIKAWEDVNELNDTLSINYGKALRRYEMRKLVEVSDLTSSGNPKEFKFVDKLQEELLDIPGKIENYINEVVKRNEGTSTSPEETFPF